jgi:hypothetical protein
MAAKMSAEYQREYMRTYRLTPKGRYNAQKQTAKWRGVEFNMTFDEWWSVWEPHWDRREQEDLCMCRTGDKGAYEVGNVRIDTRVNNVKEQRNAVI